MSSDFRITFVWKNGDLHVCPSGTFDGTSAWELIRLLYEKYDGRGRVVIDARRLREICRFGRNTFRCRFNLAQVPAERLFFRGSKGRRLAPKGSREFRPGGENKCEKRSRKSGAGGPRRVAAPGKGGGAVRS